MNILSRPPPKKNAKKSLKEDKKSHILNSVKSTPKTSKMLEKNLIQNQEKNQPVETDSKIIKIMELSGKGVRTAVRNMFTDF